VLLKNFEIERFPKCSECRLRPSRVPGGNYAQKALTSLGLWEKVKDRLAQTESVRATLLWLGVTTHPTAEWIARQVTEPCGWESAPHYLIRDRYSVFGEAFTRRIRAMLVRTTPATICGCAPNAWVVRTCEASPALRYAHLPPRSLKQKGDGS
jgi:hypothetical protein